VSDSPIPCCLWCATCRSGTSLFAEMVTAYKEGRTDGKNPADSWYEGEIGFFNFYIIPLAKKLKECKVFGVSSDEYLKYAEKNLSEWESRGQEVVAELMEKYNCPKGSSTTVDRMVDTDTDGDESSAEISLHEQIQRRLAPSPPGMRKKPAVSTDIRCL
jgi:hypothetical protein